MNTIANLLIPEDISLDVKVADKAHLLDEIGKHMERRHALSRDWVIAGLSRREQAGSTGLGQGVAIPHARVRDLDRILVAYMRLKPAIPFDAPDGKPVSDVLVLLVPKPATEEHLRILADAAQMFADIGFRKRLRACAHPQEVSRTFVDWPNPA